jgi:hypothetical protein
MLQQYSARQSSWIVRSPANFGKKRSRCNKTIFSSSASGEGPPDRHRERVRTLNELFYATPDANDDDSLSTASRLRPFRTHSQTSRFGNLPLWRVQWAILPGFQVRLHCAQVTVSQALQRAFTLTHHTVCLQQEVLSVHVPHYCHMFEGIMAAPRPWIFGHVYLPSGSQALGRPEFALEPGTQAPLVGTLMEIRQAVRLEDGRLLLLAAGLTRIKVRGIVVLRASQTGFSI